MLAESAGSGTGWPSSRSRARCSAIASSINCWVFSRVSAAATPGRSGGRRVACGVVALEDDYGAPHGHSLRNPACFRMLASVFGSNVALGARLGPRLYG